MHAVSLIRVFRRVALVAAAAGLAVAASGQELKPDVRYEMIKAFRESFVYASAPAANPAAPTRDPSVILLRPVVVRNRFEADGLDQSIARQDLIDDRFTLYKGGAIYRKDEGRVRIDLGTWGSASGLNLLKVSW
jgi:hypothetical protein